jgi:four helix bundle protein
MRYDRFEQLPVWQAAIDAGERVDRLIEHPYFRGRGALRDQLDRASISISNNIAEGFERGTTEELITFIYYARGSAGEIRSMCRLLLRRTERAGSDSEISNLKSEISDFKSQISDLKSQTSNLRSQISALIPICESISRQLHGWAEHLQNSGIEGPRRLTEAGRADFERTKQKTEFIKRLNELRPRYEEPG